MRTVQWARANGCPWNSKACLKAAAKNVHMQLLEWLLKNDQWDQDTLESLLQEIDLEFYVVRQRLNQEILAVREVESGSLRI